jgi:hypothetical protein
MDGRIRVGEHSCSHPFYRIPVLAPASGSFPAKSGRETHADADKRNTEPAIGLQTFAQYPDRAQQRAENCTADPMDKWNSRSNKVFTSHTTREYPMLGWILIVILVLVLVGALPSWPYSSGWGYYPSGGLGLLVIIVLILVLLGRL